MQRDGIREIIGRHRKFFASGATRDISFRTRQLKALRRAVRSHETAIYDALRKDLHKPPVEVYGGETGMILSEIDHALRHLDSWTKPRRFRTPLVFQPASSRLVPEPYGTALIISPWNFPFQLTFMPLIGAISAGNCAVLKPPVAALHSADLIASIVSRTFDTAYISAVPGGAETGQTLLEEKFDYIFFTGGPSVGRLVMQAAAKHLTPVTLELGGKNPCIVDTDVDLDVTARRIAWGKFFNAGQNCVAVDYVLAPKQIKRKLLDRIAGQIAEFYGADPTRSPDYARIVDDDHFNRLARLLQKATVFAGGRADQAGRFIEPTILDNVGMQDPVMEDEIFGPLLPVIEYETLSDAIAMVNSRPKPLALYVFSRSTETQERVLREISSGGACINDTVIHESWSLPFGGVGESGMGKYHGKASFDTFSHYRAIMKSPFWFDLRMRYPPYRNALKWIKRLL